MKKNDDLYWIAMCVGFDEENKETLGSILTFWARNKFHALKAVEGMLPAEDKWVRPDGTTRPHHLWALEQCSPDDAGRMCMLYSHTFYEMMNSPRPARRGAA
jgi:hypothetical protein